MLGDSEPAPSSPRPTSPVRTRPDDPVSPPASSPFFLEDGAATVFDFAGEGDLKGKATRKGNPSAWRAWCLSLLVIGLALFLADLGIMLFGPNGSFDGVAVENIAIYLEAKGDSSADASFTVALSNLKLRSYAHMLSVHGA